MSKSYRLSIAAAVSLFIVSCGGGGSNNSNGNPTPEGVVFTTPAISPTIELGQTVSLQVSVSGGKGVTWSLENGIGKGKGPGQITNASATSATYAAPPMGTQPICNPLSAPPQTLQAVVVATSVANPAQSASIVISVAQTSPCVGTVPSVLIFAAGGGIDILNTCPPAGTPVLFDLVNNPQVFQVGAFNQVQIYDGGGRIIPVASPFGVAPFTWKVSSGSLPVGVNVVAGTNSSNIVLNGTPVSPGCSNFTLQITDATGVSTSAPFFLLTVPSSLKVQIPSLPNAFFNGSVAVPYPPVAMVASGGLAPYTWTYNPNPSGPSGFPPGLCLTSSTSSVPTGCVNNPVPASSNVGVISGTPTSQSLLGVANSVQLEVNDNQQPYPAVGLANFSMTVNSQPGFCSAAPPLPPQPGLNGGTISGGEVPGDFYLQGTMAFLARGFDGDGPVVMAGSVNFSSDGSGTVTGGEMDVTRSSGTRNLTIVSNGSSYTVGLAQNAQVSYNRGCMTLADSTGGKTTFAFSLGGCSNRYTESGITTTGDNACGMKQNSQQQNIAAGYFTFGRLIEFDDNTGKGTRVTGILRLQDTSSFSAGLSGPYAFGLSGNTTSGHYAAAGSFRATGGSLSAVAADTDNAGTLGTQLTGGSGTLSSIDANGRGTATLTIGKTSIDFAVYIVSKGESILASTDAVDATQPITGGEAITTATSFSNASVQNSHMFHVGGLTLGCTVVAAGCPDVGVGVVAFDGVGSFTGTISEAQSGTFGTTSLSGAYAVDPNTGRTVFSAPAIGQNLGPHPFVGYLVPAPASLTRGSCSTPANCVTGFLVGTDNTAQDGTLEFQTGLTSPPPPFTSRFVVGDFIYGDDENLNTSGANVDGDADTFPSSSSLTSGSITSQFQDRSFGSANYCSQSGCQLLIPNESFSGSYTVSPNGTGSFGGGTASVSNGRVVFYLDQSPLNLYPTVIVAEQ